MRVVMLSTADFAGSGNKLCVGVSNYTDIHIRLIIRTEKVTYGYDHDYSLEYCANNFLQSQILDKADIIHFKGDELPENIWNGLKIYDKPVIVTVGGSGFRRNTDNLKGNRVAKQWDPIECYVKNSDFRTALTPDLNYPEFKGIYTQQTIDSIATPYSYSLGESIKIAHSPSCRAKKGTDDYILPAIERLRNEGYVFEFDLIEKVDNKECIDRKKKANLFIDQISNTGFYGISTLEAIKYGIPTMCYISKQSKEQSNGKITDECPIINVGMSISSVYEKLKYYLENPIKLTELSLKTKEYSDSFHDESVVAKMWFDIYQDVYIKNIERINNFKELIHNKKDLSITDSNYVFVKIRNRKFGKINEVQKLPKNVAWALVQQNFVEILK